MFRAFVVEIFGSEMNLSLDIACFTSESSFYKGFHGSECCLQPTGRRRHRQSNPVVDPRRKGQSGSARWIFGLTTKGRRQLQQPLRKPDAIRGQLYSNRLFRFQRKDRFCRKQRVLRAEESQGTLRFRGCGGQRTHLPGWGNW